MPITMYFLTSSFYNKNGNFKFKIFAISLFYTGRITKIFITVFFPADLNNRKTEIIIQTPWPGLVDP
jgi:hypothetical protein